VQQSARGLVWGRYPKRLWTKKCQKLKHVKNVKMQRTLQGNNNETRWDRMEGEKKKYVRLVLKMYIKWAHGGRKCKMEVFKGKYMLTNVQRSGRLRNC
jgi:hypothetical protein